MRRGVAGALGSVAIPLAFVTMNVLAGVAILGAAVLLLVHALTGIGPKPVLPIPLELLAVAIAIGSVIGVVGLVAWLIPG